MAFASAALCRHVRRRGRTRMCARRNDDQGDDSRDLAKPGAAQAAAGGAMLADFVANVADTVRAVRGVRVPPTIDDLDNALVARGTAQRERDEAARGVQAAQARLVAVEDQLAALVPDVGERERRVDSVRNGEPVGAVDVDGLLDGARAGVDGVVAQCEAAAERRMEAESELARRRTEVARLRDMAASGEVGESQRALAKARKALDVMEECVREKRVEAESVAAELREACRVVDGLKADIAAVEAYLPSARLAADGAREESRRRDRESCRALDLLVDELEKATEESAAVLTLAQANLDRSVVREIEATKNVLAARIRRAEAVMRSIVSAKERRAEAVSEVLEEDE